MVCMNHVDVKCGLIKQNACTLLTIFEVIYYVVIFLYHWNKSRIKLHRHEFESSTYLVMIKHK